MPPTTTTPSAVTAALAKDRLGVFSVIMFALTAAAPLMVVGGVVTTGWAVTGVTGFPLAFLVIGVLLAIFCVGYVAMSRHITNAGAFYTYIARGISRSTGVGGSFVALIAYNLLQIGLYGIFGLLVSGELASRFNVKVEWWVCALAAWLVVAILGLLRVDVNSMVLGVLLLLELALVLVFDVVDLAHPAGGHVSFATLSPSSLPLAAMGAVLVIAITGFVGFEGPPVYSEESRDPHRTVPAATYLSLAVMAGVYALTAWAMAVTVGDANIVKASQDQSSELIFNSAAAHLGGQVLIDIGHILFVTSVFAAMISYHNAVARYSFSLGREGVLPRALAATSARTGAPIVASIAQSALALLVLAVYAAAGWDPLVQLFFWMGATGGLGILILLVATSIAIIGYFLRNPSGESAWSRLIAPGLAAIGLVFVLYMTLDSYSSTLGVQPGTFAYNFRWIFPAAYAVAALVGIVWALVLRSTRPAVYDAIGMGAETSEMRADRAAVATTEPAEPTEATTVAP
jgi:amino acid transporter